jgi:nitrogen fixation protein NifB
MTGTIMELDIQQHPCFNVAARGTAARIHLPVAPRCNVQCNFCDRRFDCLNESRPGVTSAILTPPQAAFYLEKAKEKLPRIRVVGIAGPGDPFACPEETLETLRLVRERYPDMLLCVASNGLEVEAHAAELAKLQVSHVTITVNAVDPEIGARVYAWVRDGYRTLRGVEAARTLLERQRRAIAALKKNGVVVKINTIIMPGINDEHVSVVAREVAALGADIMNCIPLYPVEGTPFASLPSVDHTQLKELRRQTSASLPQMLHCTRCRADAAGLLGETQSEELVELLRTTAAGPTNPIEKRPFFAVASHEGLLINQHLGEATQFWVFDPASNGPTGPVLVETREAPEAGSGSQRWYELADVLHDCTVVFTTACGQNPKRVLERHGVRVVEAVGLATDAIQSWSRTGAVPRGMQRLFQGCARGCAGPGSGCG